MIFLEVFAGSGNLSGLTVHGIDHITNRQTGVSIHVLDLTKSSDVDILLDMALRANIASAHFAPPCRTSSKARERLFPGDMQGVRAERKCARTFFRVGRQFDFNFILHRFHGVIYAEFLIGAAYVKSGGCRGASAVVSLPSMRI